MWPRRKRKRSGEEATPADALTVMAEMVIQKDPEGNVPGWKDRKEPVYRVVYHASADPGTAWITDAEDRVPIPYDTVREAAEGSHVVHAEKLEDPGDDGVILFSERGTVAAEERDPPVLEPLRGEGLARDGHRCLL